MNKSDKIILIIVAFIILVPILFNEIKEYNLRKLKEEVLYISGVLENYSDELEEIDIYDGVIINDEKIKIRGSGKAYVEKDSVIVVVSYKGYCAVKIPSIDEVALSKSKCPDAEIVNGKIIEK